MPSSIGSMSSASSATRYASEKSLAMQRPAQLYQPSTRAMPRWIAAYDYLTHFLVRRVSRDGTIRVLNK